MFALHDLYLRYRLELVSPRVVASDQSFEGRSQEYIIGLACFGGREMPRDSVGMALLALSVGGNSFCVSVLLLAQTNRLKMTSVKG